MIIDDMCYTDEDLKNIFKLQEAIYNDSGQFLNIEEVVNVWQNYSWSLSASWLFFNEDPLINIKCIKQDREFTNFKDYSKI